MAVKLGSDLRDQAAPWAEVKSKKPDYFRYGLSEPGGSLPLHSEENARSHLGPLGLPAPEPGPTGPCPSEDASWPRDFGRVLNASFPPWTPSLASGVKGLTAGMRPRRSHKPLWASVCT